MRRYKTRDEIFGLDEVSYRANEELDTLQEGDVARTEYKALEPGELEKLNVKCWERALARTL